MLAQIPGPMLLAFLFKTCSQQALACQRPNSRLRKPNFLQFHWHDCTANAGSLFPDRNCLGLRRQGISGHFSKESPDD